MISKNKFSFCVQNPFGNMIIDNEYIWHMENTFHFLDNIYNKRCDFFCDAYSLLANSMERLYKGIIIELAKIQVTGKEAKKRDDGNYEITISDIPTYADIYAKAQEETTNIEIYGGTTSVGEKHATILSIAEGQYLEVPVKLTAADGTEYEYQLYITVKSGDNNVGTIRVNNLEATKIDDKTYRSFVQESAVQATVDVTAKSELSNIKSDSIRRESSSCNDSLANASEYILLVLSYIGL